MCEQLSGGLTHWRAHSTQESLLPVQGKWRECLNRDEKDLEKAKQLWKSTLMIIRMFCSQSRINSALQGICISLMFWVMSQQGISATSSPWVRGDCCDNDIIWGQKDLSLILQAWNPGWLSGLSETVINLDVGKRSVPGESSTSSHVRHCTVRSERLQPDFSERLRMLSKERGNTFPQWRKECLYFNQEECLGKEVLLSWSKH